VHLVNLRRALLVANGFVAVTAVGGGIAMLSGLDEFPRSWLRGTPFRDYRIPAMLLAGVVGGSGAAATMATYRSSRWSGPASVVAGAALMTYILVEMRILDYSDDPTDDRWIEPAYLSLGAALIAMGVAGARRS
jgi:hypothetical protein